jgi:hypothetical protein
VGGASGAGGGSSGYNPCPATGACKILPLGDSITDGIGFSGGYRVRLFQLALEDDKEITFVGGSMNGSTWRPTSSSSTSGRTTCIRDRTAPPIASAR